MVLLYLGLHTPGSFFGPLIQSTQNLSRQQMVTRQPQAETRRQGQAVQKYARLQQSSRCRCPSRTQPTHRQVSAVRAAVAQCVVE